jgi:hypothetical protein
MLTLWQVFFTVETPDTVLAETVERTVTETLQMVLPAAWQVEGVASLPMGSAE